MREDDRRRFNRPPRVRRPPGKLPRLHVQFWLNPNLPEEREITQKLRERLAEWGDDQRAFFGALLTQYVADGAPDLRVSSQEIEDLRQTVRWIAEQMQAGAITPPSAPEPKRGSKKNKAIEMPETISSVLDRYMNAGMSANDTRDDE